MARVSKPAQANYSAVASPNGGVHGKFHVETPSKADNPSCIMLDSVNDSGVVTTYFLWVDSNGALRILVDAPPTNQDSDGTIVGTQS